MKKYNDLYRHQISRPRNSACYEDLEERTEELRVRFGLSRRDVDQEESATGGIDGPYDNMDFAEGEAQDMERDGDT